MRHHVDSDNLKIKKIPVGLDFILASLVNLKSEMNLKVPRKHYQ